MDSLIPDMYRSDHLFLLIGTNPIPNYVAAKLLLRPNGKLYLIHSEATHPAAERLYSYWISEEKGVQPQYIPVIESDSLGIQDKLLNELNRIEDGGIGLNYTGGTKIMSVCSYQTLKTHQGRTKRPVALSYLDARLNTMQIEHGDSALFVSRPVLHELKPTLEQIVGLHAVKLVTQIEREPHLADLARLLLEAHYDLSGAQVWWRWCQQVLRPATRTKKAGQWDDEKTLAPVILELPTEPALRTFTTSFRQALMIEEEPFSLAAASKQAGFPKAKHLCEWLDGKWLEYHVLRILNELRQESPECRLQDAGMGIKPKVESNHPEFDVDIGAMQGYRLYAVTCTTDSDKGLCKLKLFEAYERARNMGGDEAHVGLICLNENPSSLQLQLGRSWDATDKIRVFGLPDLPELSDQLSDWFKSAG